MATSFDGENLVITLPVGITEIDAEVNLYKEWKLWALAGNMRYPEAFRTVGGDPLSTSVDAGGYFFLQNQYGWRIRPNEEDITILLTGNLVPEDATLPILIPTIGNFSVLIQGLQPITQNVDAIIDTQRKHVRNLQYLTESASRRDGHLGFGNIFYWDPVNGSDTNDGTEPDQATATPEAALALCTAHNHDVIFAIAGNAVGETTYTAPFNINKAYVSLRGPGRNFHMHNTATASAAVELSAEGTQLEGFAMTQVNGVKAALCITGENCQAQELTIHDCVADAIEVRGARAAGNSAAKTSLKDIRCLHNPGGHGIHIIDSDAVIMTGLLHMEECIDGIHIEGTCTEVHAFRPILHLNTGYGVNVIDTTVAETIIDQPLYALNALGTLLDGGTSTKEFLYTAEEVWNKPMEGTFTAEELMRLMSSALAAKISGAENKLPVFRDINDTKNRISATTDTNGNRTVVTLDAT